MITTHTIHCSIKLKYCQNSCEHLKYSKIHAWPLEISLMGLENVYNISDTETKSDFSVVLENDLFCLLLGELRIQVHTKS